MWRRFLTGVPFAYAWVRVLGYKASGYLDILFYTQQFPDTMSEKGAAEPWMANQYRLRTSPTHSHKIFRYPHV